MGTESHTRVDDVDEVIGIAATRTAQDETMLSRDEMRAIGADVGIGSDAIDDAIVALGARREAERLERDLRRVEHRRLLARLTIGASIAAAIAVAGVAWHAEARRDHRTALVAAYAVVQERDAALLSARERRTTVERIAEAMNDTVARDAERLGAANRVSVAERRRAEAIRIYETLLADPLGEEACGDASAPCTVPRDTEVAP